MKKFLSKLGSNFLGLKNPYWLFLITWLVSSLMTSIAPLFNGAWLLHFAVVILVFWPLRNAAKEIQERLKENDKENIGG